MRDFGLNDLISESLRKRTHTPGEDKSGSRHLGDFHSDTENSVVRDRAK